MTAAIGRIATLEGAVKTLNETTLPALKAELEQAIATAVAAEAAIARKAEEDLGKRIDDLAAASVSVAEKSDGHVTVSKATDEKTGAVVYTIAESDIASAQALTDEIKRAGDEEARIEGLVTAEAGRAAGEEARIEGLVNTEKGRAEGVEAGLQAAINTLNGADTVSGSVAKAVKDAKDSLIGGAKTLTDFAQVETAIANAESAAKAAASVVKEGTDAGNNLSIVPTTGENGATTYTVNLTDVASAAKVDTLIGEDANKSVRTIANEELAKQLIAEGADEALDTLQEIAQWIQDHPGDAAAMNDAIAQLQKDVDAIEADYLTSTDKTELTGAIATAKGEAIDAAASNAAAAISEAIGKLDAEVTSADGSKVTVKVTETDGVITAVNVTESDIASAKDLSDLAKVVEDNEHTTAAAVNELNERINNLPTEVGVMSVTKGTDGKFVTTTIGGDDARPTISVAVDYVDGSETSGTTLTTDTYVGEAIAAAVAAKNVDAEGDDLVEASPANNKVTVAATQALKDAVAAANSAVQSVKSEESTLKVTQEGTTVNVELAWQSF